MKKLSKKKRLLIALACLVLVAALTAGTCYALGGVIDGYIDAPKELQIEDLGTYTIPTYEVVDKNGMVLAGYHVRLKSAAGPNGEALDASGGFLTVEVPGVYSFVYTADVRNVEDVTVQVDFGDRTAPTISLNGTLPDFYITGNYYKIPSYTVAGDADKTKCYMKVVYISPDGKEQEVAVKGNRFLADAKEGEYVIRIHVEDAAGNFNDYEYRRSVDGPEHYDPETVLYFGEEFGQKQVELYEQGKYTGEFVSKAEAPDRVHGDDTGAYKVSFSGEPTQNNEGYISMKTPAILDISDCIELEMYVYNDSDADIIMGSCWWNDQVVKKGEWTRLTWPVSSWGGTVGNVPMGSAKTIGTTDISGTMIRFIFDYSGEVVPTGTFYLSPMRVVQAGPSEVTAGEHVHLDRTEFRRGDVVQLSADEIEGKVVDCYLADGVPLVGDTFIPTGEKHEITVRYVDKLTYSNMTWGSQFYATQWYGNEAWMEGNLCFGLGANNATSWALRFDIVGGYDADAKTNQLFNAAIQVGDIHLIELQINRETPSLCKWYGEEAWGEEIGKLPEQIVERIAGASDTKPVHVLALRRGNDIYIFADEFFLGKTSLEGKPIQGDWFGYAARLEDGGTKRPAIRNLEAVAGEERADLVYEQKKYYLTVEEHDDLTVISGDRYTAPAAIIKDIDGNVLQKANFSIHVNNKPASVYKVSGRDITIGYAGAVDLDLTYTATGPDGKGSMSTSIKVTVQKSTGIVMDPSETAANTIDPNGNTVSFDPKLSHQDDKGSIKVVAGGNDVGVILNKFRFTGYDSVSFWVYTEEKNTQSGAYWLGDTKLIPGRWNKVRLDLTADGVYLRDDNNADFCPNTYHKGQPYVGKLVLRFMGEGCKEGSTFWISSVQAYRKADVPVSTDPQMVVDAGTEAYELTHDGGSAEYTTEKPYTGSDVLVTGSENGSMKVTVGGPEVSVCVAGAVVDEISQYDYVYFYAYTDAIGLKSGGWWCGDTPLKAGQWTKIVLTKDMKPQNSAGRSIFEDTPNLFAYRFMGGKEGDVVYATSLYAVKNGTVQEIGINTANVTTDKRAYKQGDTVTLTAALQEQEGLELVYVVNGKLLEGNTFVVEDINQEYNAAALYRDPVTGGMKVLDASSLLVFHQDQAAVQGYVTEQMYDGYNPLVQCGDSGAMKVLVTGPEAHVALNDVLVKNIGAFKQLYFYVYTEAKGVQAGSHWCSDTQLVPGVWTKVTITNDPATNLTDITNKLKLFESGMEHFFYRFMKAPEGSETVFYVTSLYAENEAGQEPIPVQTVNCSADRKTYLPGSTAKLSSDIQIPEGMELVYAVNGEILEGNTFPVEEGKSYRAVALLRQKQTGGMMIVGADTQNIAGVQDENGNIFCNGSFVTDKVYTGDDKLVQSSETGSIKVENITSGDASLCVNNALVNDISAYDYVYFYAYTESTGVVAGGWWLGDTELVPGQWTKVVLPKVPVYDWQTVPLNVHSKPIFENGPAVFVYRFQKAQDATVYVTGLYAGALPQVTVEVTGCTTDKESYKQGETVTLIPNAPDGQVLDYFTVNGKLLTSLSFTAEELHYTVEAVYKPANKVLNSNVWAPSLGTNNHSVAEADNEKHYGEEAGSVKVTAAEQDNGIYLPTFDFTGYDYVEFYVYTEVENAQAASYWCGDTALIPNQWTKVRVPLDHASLCLKDPVSNESKDEIWPNRDHVAPVGRLVVRFMKCQAGDEFWFSAVTAGKYEPITVETVNCHADKESYKPGETVTLTADPAPKGKEFDCFQVNGERIEGSTFLVQEGQTYKAEALYRDQQPIVVQTVNCTADKPSYMPGDTVTLTATITAPEGMELVYTVNGEILAGNTFVPESDSVTYRAAVLLRDVKTQTIQVNDIHKNPADSFKTVEGSFDTIAIDPGKVYDGGNELVRLQDHAGSLKLKITGADSHISIPGGVLNDISMYDQVYFYAYTDDSGILAGGRWCWDTTLVPGEWTLVTVKKEASPYGTTPQNGGGKPIFEVGPDGFVYRFQNAVGKTVYVTGLYAGTPNEQTPVTLHLTGCTADKTAYYPGQTVKLTAPSVEGKVFDHFRINNVAQTENTFTVEAGVEYTVEAIYRAENDVFFPSELSVPNLSGNGSKTEFDAAIKPDGAIGSVKVTAAEQDNGIYLPTFDFTGYDYVEFYVYTEVENAQAGSWWLGDTALTPGQWTKVRISLDHVNLYLKNPTDDGEIKPNQGNFPAPIGRLVVRLGNQYGKTIPANTEFWFSAVTAGKYEPAKVADISDVSKLKVNAGGDSYEFVTDKVYDGSDALVRAGDPNGSLKVTVSGDGNNGVMVYHSLVTDISMYDQLYFYAYTDAEGVVGGSWWCGDMPLKPGQWTKIILTKNMGLVPGDGQNNSIFQNGPDGFIYRFQNAAGKTVYVTGLYAEMAQPTKVADISDVSKLTNKGSVASFEYVTDKVYNGSNALVLAGDPGGSLKVTVSGSDAGLMVCNPLVKDIDVYAQVYFYVYTDAKDTKAGSWWCGDTALTPGQWTKVTITKDMNFVKDDHSTKIFTTGPDKVIYRFMGGSEGTVFYVTGLYAEKAH